MLQEPINQNNTTFEDFVNSTMGNDTKRLMVLSNEEYNKWEKKKYSEMPKVFRDENLSCPITCEDYNNDTILVKMPCSHIMSEEACKEWFKINYKCPFCRKEFENREMNDEEYEIYKQTIEKQTTNEPPTNQDDISTDSDDIDDMNYIPELSFNSRQLFNSNPILSRLQNIMNMPIRNNMTSRINYSFPPPRQTYINQEELDLQRALEESMKDISENN